MFQFTQLETRLRGILTANLKREIENGTVSGHHGKLGDNKAEINEGRSAEDESDHPSASRKLEPDEV